MLGKLAKAIGDAKAPKKTHLLRHPVKGIRNLLMLRGARTLVTRRTGAVAGAVLAVPLTLLALKGLRGQKTG
jgi:hypothetical protein